MPVVAQGHLVLRGRDLQVHGPTEGHLQLHRLHARLPAVDLQDLLPGLVADHDQPLAVVEPVDEPVAHPVPAAVLEHRPLVVVEAEGLASGGDGQGAALGVQAGAVQEAARADEFAVALHPRAAVDHLHQALLVLGHVVDVEVRAGMVDDAPTVAAGVADVVVLVVRVAAQVRAVGPDAVEVADALVVADEEDAAVWVVHALGDPHGRGDVSLQVLQDALEVAVPVAVDPELAGGAAPVALPASRVPGVASQDHLAVGAEGDGPGRAVGQELRLAVGRLHGDAVEEVLAPVGPAVGAGEVDVLPGCVPAQDPAVAAHVGEAAEGPAIPGHDVDLGHALLPAHEGQQGAVRGEHGVGGLAQVAGQAPGHAPGRGDAPEIVLGDEDDGVVLDGGKAVVAGSLGLRLVLHGDRRRGGCHSRSLLARDVQAGFKRAWPRC